MAKCLEMEDMKRQEYIKMKILSLKLLLDLGEINTKEYLFKSDIYLDELQMEHGEYFKGCIPEFQRHGII